MRRALLTALLTACSFEGRAGGGDVEPLVDGSTEPDAASDAALPDGVIDATLACPTGYEGNYRAIVTFQDWLTAERDCEDDLAGATHLAVPNDETERAALAALIQALPGDAAIGIVRDPGGEAPWMWRYVTGEPATFAPFEATEPNNMSGDQYITVMRKSSGFLYDYNVGATGLTAVCECDGKRAINADYDPATTN